VTVELKGRKVTVTGPRGVLKRDFGHQTLEITQVSDDIIRVDKWFGKKKELAAIRSICSAITNMFTGVTKGFRYDMRLVYAHFPINVSVDAGKVLNIRNFLGCKKNLHVTMRADTTIDKGTIKDSLVLEGNDIDAVSQSAADIQQICKIRNKDIRKFLDGIYVSKKGPIEVAE